LCHTCTDNYYPAAFQRGSGSMLSTGGNYRHFLPTCNDSRYLRGTVYVATGAFRGPGGGRLLVRGAGGWGGWALTSGVIL